MQALAAPVSTTPLGGRTEPARLTDAIQRLGESQWYWLGTCNPRGFPQSRPVLGIVLGGTVCFTTRPDARKGQNLAANLRCCVTVELPEVHLVVEGQASRLGASELPAASRGFAAKYGWPTRPRGDLLEAEYSAPTAGGSPFAAYRVWPSTMLAFPVLEDELRGGRPVWSPTRWAWPS